MAASKDKNVQQKKQPLSPEARNIKNPDSFNGFHPSWCFSACDITVWMFSKDDFILEILPRLKEWEAKTWNEILIHAKKANHSIDTKQLNQVARDRLDKLRIEANAVISLRIQGSHRLYGYRIGSVFYILWFDPNHGDNDTCVCRSRKKHT